MQLFPPRPRPRLTWKQLAITCGVLLVVNLALSIWSATDVEARRRAAMIGPPPGFDPQWKAAARPAPYLEALRYLSIILACNAAVLGGLAYAVLARYLEDLRRYQLCLPTGFDETRLRPRMAMRGQLVPDPSPRRPSDGDPPLYGDDEPPRRRLNWPD
jgi:hypothetical protein